jgi:hypothetical protein
VQHFSVSPQPVNAGLAPRIDAHSCGQLLAHGCRCWLVQQWTGRNLLLIESLIYVTMLRSLDQTPTATSWQTPALLDKTAVAR